MVNMAGCEWGRDCWGEMYNFRELSYYLNRTWWGTLQGGPPLHDLVQVDRPEGQVLGAADQGS